MKLLLTGASGFVGGRVLARLVAAKIPTRVLMRRTPADGTVTGAGVEVCLGSLEETSRLRESLDGVTHVIHCAGKTKALEVSEFRRVNVDGTARLVEAMNHSESVEKLVHISSLAASGPGTAENPSHEDDPPHPVSEYGRSKLAGEQVVRTTLAKPWVILRPGGVYGPGDRDFLQLFRAVRWRVCPRFGDGCQPLNLVYVDDLAGLALEMVQRPDVASETFNVAHPEILSAVGLAKAVAAASQRSVLHLRLPKTALGLVCAWGDLLARWTRRPGILSRERAHELSAPGWVCDVSRLRQRLGYECPTSLREGIARTLEWYRGQGWLA